MKPQGCRTRDGRLERLLELLRQGHNRNTACAAVGISDRTLRLWCERARRGEPEYEGIAEQVAQAESKLEIDLVDRIVVHSLEDWRAAAFVLERRFPLRWGEARGAAAKLEAERQAMIEAMVGVLEKRGLSETAEEVVRELAGGGEDNAPATGSAAGATH